MGLNSDKPRILVVDDEPDAVELVRFNLRKAGMDVVIAATGHEAVEQAREILPDAIVLDVMLPGMDGLEVCKTLRRQPETVRIPIIMLTAKGSELDRVLGLELGAADYVTKPFSPRELVLRVKKLLHRGQEPEEKAAVLRFEDLVIDIEKYEVFVGGRPVNLTYTEFHLLTRLAQRVGRVQSRDQLLTEVWGYDGQIETRTVDTHVRRLREKLGAAAYLIETVRGVGYRFVEGHAG
jgi:DNA-binding response OmpR family regulator